MSNKHSNNLRPVLSLLAAFALVTGAATAQSDDTVTYAIDADITNLDPIHAIDPGSAAVYLQINEPLVRINMEGDIVPVLATGWSVSEDNVTWTFELREGVTFHDGSAFNAEAVKAHFDRLLDPEQPNRSAGSFDMVAEVSAPTEYQVSFELTKPFAPFLALMTSPTATITSPTAVELYGNDYPFNPVGTGPWMFDSWAAGERTTLIRNDNYWGEGPGVSRLVFQPVAEPGARIIMLETGAADAASAITPEEIERIEGVEGISVETQPVLRGWFIGFNMLEAPFDDVRVRRALNHAIDVEVITEVLLEGTGAPLTSAVNSKVWGHVVQPDYEYNPELARELLAEAGYPNGFDSRLWHPVSGQGFVPDVPVAIQAMLSEVGVNLTVEPLELAAFVDAIIQDPDQSRESDKQMMMAGIGAGTGEASNIMTEFFHTDSWAPVGTNRGFYSNPEVDALLEEAISTFDQEVQQSLLAEAQAIVWEDAPWIFLYEMLGVYGVSDSLNGVQYLPSNYILFNTVSK